MFHACLVSTLLCFVYTLRYFYMFSGTNLLTDAIVAFARFLLFLVTEKAENQYSWNWTGQKPKSIFYHGRHEFQRGDGEANHGHHTLPRRGWSLPRAWVGCGPSGLLLASPISSPR